MTSSTSDKGTRPVLVAGFSMRRAVGADAFLILLLREGLRGIAAPLDLLNCFVLRAGGKDLVFQSLSKRAQVFDEVLGMDIPAGRAGQPLA